MQTRWWLGRYGCQENQVTAVNGWHGCWQKQRWIQPNTENLIGDASPWKRIMSQSILQRTPESFTRQRNSVFYNSQVSHLTRTQRNMWFSCWRQNWRQHPVSLKVWEAVKTLIGPNSVLRGHNFRIFACMYMLYVQVFLHAGLVRSRSCTGRSRSDSCRGDPGSSAGDAR